MINLKLSKFQFYCIFVILSWSLKNQFKSNIKGKKIRNKLNRIIVLRDYFWSSISISDLFLSLFVNKKKFMPTQIFRDIKF